MEFVFDYTGSEQEFVVPQIGYYKLEVWGAFGGNYTDEYHGGSGYIVNSSLIDKVMYCYACTESNGVSTKTISTTNVSHNAVSEYAKIGNGYAKITYIGTSK